MQGLGAIAGEVSNPTLITGAGGTDPVPESDKILLKRLLDSKVSYDNKTAKQIIESVSQRTGLPKEFIAASALQEGMNEAISHPENASLAYTNAKVDQNKFPVDGFYNYGLDTFSDAYDRLVKKGYLPKDFAYHPYKAFNEQNKPVNTAAFRNNEDALVAKAAYLKDFMDSVNGEAEKRGLKLTDRAMRYFTMAGYNGGLGSVRDMMDEMASGKTTFDDYIKAGSKKRGQVHKNVMPRMYKMDFLSTLFNDKTSTQ